MKAAEEILGEKQKKSPLVFFFKSFCSCKCLLPFLGVLGVKSLGLQTVFVGLILVSISKLWISLKRYYHNMDLFGPISLIVLAGLSILVKKLRYF